MLITDEIWTNQLIPTEYLRSNSNNIIIIVTYYPQYTRFKSDRYACHELSIFNIAKKIEFKISIFMFKMDKNRLLFINKLLKKIIRL